MYSVVLVMALAGGAEAPDCHCGIRSACGCTGYVGYSGCYGGGYGGCRGGCYGGSCYGGGCYGGGCYGGGCYGGGCYGGGCYGGGCYGGGMYTTPTPAPASMPKAEKVPAPKKDQVVIPTPATIVVTLPANSKLTIDGYVSQQTTAQRRLVTPALPPGQEFNYTLVAETTQNGQPVTQSQRVTVRAGQQTPVNFTFTTLPAAASR